jgi:hypothetical protein
MFVWKVSVMQELAIHDKGGCILPLGQNMKVFSTTCGSLMRLFHLDEVVNKQNV